MREKTEKIKFSDIEKTHVPLGFKKIYLEKIPLLDLEEKLMFYNNKYKFNTTIASAANKPISKILRFK